MPSPRASRRALLGAAVAGVVGTAGCAGVADRLRSPPVAWRTEVPDRYLCSPLALADGRVLAMGETRLTGLEAASGESLWRSRYFDHAVDGPVLAGRVAVVSDERPAAYRPDGTELWSREGDERFRPRTSRGDDVVGLVDADPLELGVVSALDGSHRWRRSFDELRGGYPTDAVGTERGFVVAFDDGRLLGLDAGGAARWRAARDWEPSGPGDPTLAAGDGTVVAAGAAIGGFDPATGERRWRHVLPDYASGVAVVGGIALVAVGSDDPKVDSWDAAGGLLAFDPADGTELWRIRLSGRARPPTVAGDTSWVGTADGRLVALDSETGERRWRRSVGERVETAPLVTDDRVFVGVGTPAADGGTAVVALER